MEADGGGSARIETMTTITLPDDLEARVAAAAERLGTTTETLAIEAIEKRYPVADQPQQPSTNGTLYDFLKPYIGVWDGPADNLGSRVKEIFAEGMEEKKRQGRL